MTDLLEIKEKIKLFYSRFEMFILPVVKFLLAFVALNTVNGRMGYMSQLDNMAVVLIAALACSFLPTGSIVAFAALFSLLHMYALSVEAALTGFCMYLIMFLLYFRFTPRDSLVVVLTPLLFAFRIPYVVPIVVGLVCGPSSLISLGCGVCVYYLLQTVVQNSSAINTMGEDAVTDKLRTVVDSFLGNKEMLVMLAAFVITALVVYLIRRMSIDHAWTIAMVSGVLLNIVIVLVGALLYDIDRSMVGVILGSILALAAAKVVEFFRFCVDYSRTEKVQFEDDEYYYYVKAVPKMSVAMSTKTVKKINTQQARPASAGRGGYSGQSRKPRPAGTGSGAGRRTTVTEKTVSSRSGYSGQRGGYRGGKSMTIGSDPSREYQDNGQEDFDELY